MRAAPSVLSGGAFFFEGGHLLTLTPINLKTANAFVQQYHRHHKPTRGHKFSIGVSDNGALVGVAICGRPVARRLDDGYTLEVNRLCTNGTPNACSILYAAAYRAARAMGYNKVITYILDTENGSSLKAAGYTCEGRAGGLEWNGVKAPKQADQYGQRFVQMRSEQTKNPPPSIILHESGAFVTQTALGFDGEATRKMSAFLQGQKPELLHHQKFFENGTAERAKESGTEQNYNMIDGCVNNVPQKPRRIGGRWSVLDRLHIKQAERRQKDNTPQQEQERSRKS